MFEAARLRRVKLGEPVVRYNQVRNWWEYVCPFPDGCAGGYRDEFRTAEDAHKDWADHARTRHPGKPRTWPTGVAGPTRKAVKKKPGRKPTPPGQTLFFDLP